MLEDGAELLGLEERAHHGPPALPIALEDLLELLAAVVAPVPELGFERLLGRQVAGA